MMQVRLKPGLPGGRWAWLRPLRGHDEAFLSGTGPVEAIAFLDRLLVEAAGTSVGPAKTRDLAVSDCDRLFGAIHVKYFGDRIESTVECRDCAKPFELGFCLRDIIKRLDEGEATNTTGPDDKGIYTATDGRRFRLPTAGDQESIMGLEAEEAVKVLLDRCVVEGDPSGEPELLQAAMNEVGAFLDFDLQAVCPECNAPQAVRFDIQSYVLRALAEERRFLSSEVHRMAMAYGWGHQEILNLTREDRRAFVRLIEADHQSRGVQG